MGTIVAAPKQWVTVDDRATALTPIVVSCGKHTVQSGKRKARVIDVPCGGDIALSR
jgi:hypothetical protein